ncbi:MAG TPA: hypothetical protein VKP88_07430 [Candidatus Paceibacterota bacterium]|nr:hypothetical protein [Candidatus Paceibacterota bacterium]
MNALGYFVAVMQLYVVPFIFAIALIYLIFGVIQYFILGPGEEPVREAGRESFIKSFVWCLGGTLLYLLVAGLVGLQSTFRDISTDDVREQVESSVIDGQRPGSGRSREGVQPVPNVPRQNY